jgi:hypothetical protein
MAFYPETVYGSVSAAVAAINANMVASGWTSSGTTPNFTWTNPSGTRDRTISFYLAYAGNNYFNFQMNPNSAGSGNYTGNILLLNATSTTANFRLTMSVGANHALIVLEGPRNNEADTYDVTYGSERGFFFMGSVTPYFSADSILDQLVVGGASNAPNQVSRTSNSELRIMRSSAGTYWAPVELMAMRTMTYGTLAGDYPPVPFTDLAAGYFLSPIVVMESANGGIRGSLREVAYASEGDSKVGGEGGSPFGGAVTTLNVGGVAHNQMRPVHPSSGDINFYSPFGRGQAIARTSLDAYAGSPILYVRST